MLDTTREVEVPEGITLSLPIAGLVSRSLAFLIDIVIRFALVWVIAIIVGAFGRFGEGLFYITLFFVEWFYPVLFEVLWQGQTIGKRVLGIMVVNDDGTPITWSSSIVRNLLRFADFLPAFWIFGALSMLYSRDFKRLGDFAAGTIVIHKKDKLAQLSLLEVEGIAPKTALNLDEQSAVIAFSERQHRMSESRVEELAGYLAPWLDEAKIRAKTESATTQLTRIAKWLRGHG